MFGGRCRISIGCTVMKKGHVVAGHRGLSTYCCQQKNAKCKNDPDGNTIGNMHSRISHYPKRNSLIESGAKGKKLRTKRSTHKNIGSQSLDRMDKVWCYILIKLFTSMVENPDEADRMLKPAESAYDVDLPSAVARLKTALSNAKLATQNSVITLESSSSADHPTSKLPSTSSTKSKSEASTIKTKGTVSNASIVRRRASLKKHQVARRVSDKVVASKLAYAPAEPISLLGAVLQALVGEKSV